MAGLVLLPESAWRAHAGLVGEARREDREQQQKLAPLLRFPFHGRRLLIPLCVPLEHLILEPPRRALLHLLPCRFSCHDDDALDADVEEHRHSEEGDVHGCGHLPAAPCGVGAHEAKQVQDDGGLQRVVLDPLSSEYAAQEEYEDDQRGNEGGGVAVEEDQVSPGIRDVEDRVTGEVMGTTIGGVVLPDASRRVQSGLVCDTRRKNAEQEQVLVRFQEYLVGVVIGALGCSAFLLLVDSILHEIV
ncbi:hypothetical protein BRADI_4g43360v3 [Brachypodium distachyon]|uniref:Uncharacterized protein n=1 Tax=Brachypodium distachyon TaxID=15368 RepID=A0A2K2CTZ4_BRADI|nr:hypothetical protein BRADI_4g43360v3 [Brachypodium distachyon]